MTDDRDRKPIRDGRSPEARNMDELVIALRDVDGVYRVESGGEHAVWLIFELSDLDRKTAWEGSDIPEAAATLLFTARFVPTSFGREYNSAQDEFLPRIWFETVERVAARTDTDR